MNFRSISAALLLVLSQLSACGSKGALTLPDQKPVNFQQSSK
jgi:predicted small lipoprotein YifL